MIYLIFAKISMNFFSFGSVQTAMAIQCGICKNIMPASSFLSHKERKHALKQRVPYMKLPDALLKSGSNCGTLVKCQFCPNRIPENTMERHLKRCHIECGLCEKTLLKSNYEKHVQQKHGSNLTGLASLSQSKSSMQSDGDCLAPAVDSIEVSDSYSISQRSMSPETLTQPTPKCRNEPDVLHVDIWQVAVYIRQGRVYTKDGTLYLRNAANTF